MYIFKKEESEKSSNSELMSETEILRMYMNESKSINKEKKESIKQNVIHIIKEEETQNPDEEVINNQKEKKDEEKIEEKKENNNEENKEEENKEEKNEIKEE